MYEAGFESDVAVHMSVDETGGASAADIAAMGFDDIPTGRLLAPAPGTVNTHVRQNETRRQSIIRAFECTEVGLDDAG